MLRSLRLYSKYFLKTALQPGRRILALDVKRAWQGGQASGRIADYPGPARRQALDRAIDWLLVSQAVTGDNGMGSYHLVNHWSSSYPETTGYIIPTLIRYGQKYALQEPLDAAVRAADFLLGIQKDSGGWQGGRVSENKPEIVFNTGQVIRGMVAAYELTGEDKYLAAAVKAGNWLAGIQHPEGFWKTHALMEQPRVYDTFVDVPLLQLFRATGDDLFRKTAIKNLDWVVDRKMQPNGWFEDCDNTVRRNDRPILHTIAYTLDGLIDSSLILASEKYINAAETGASKLCTLFLTDGTLNGRYDRDWNGREYLICTGGAQVAIAWMKLRLAGKSQEYLQAAHKMINLLIYIQSRNVRESRDTLGAIPGSFPVWGRYEPFAFPNWAAKFFCDALLMEGDLIK